MEIRGCGGKKDEISIPGSAIYFKMDFILVPELLSLNPINGI